MDKLIQQVNLYQPIFRKVRKPFNAVMMGGILAAAAIAMMAATAYSTYQRHDLEQRLAKLEKEKKQLQGQVDAVKAKLKPRDSNSLLVSKKDSLSEDLRSARRLSRLLESEIGDSGKPYSAYFRSLAESSVDGLWLQQLNISRGGEALKLTGHAVKPELVPRLLQQLRNQQAFEGHSFENVLMSRAADKGQQSPVMFELETVDESEESKDAG